MAAKAFLWIFTLMVMFFGHFGAFSDAHATNNPHANALFDSLKRHKYDDARQHAARSRDALLIRYATWMAFAGDKVDHVDFSEAVTLMRLAEHWPHMNRVQLRAERAAWHGMESGKVDDDDVEDFCEDYPPISGLGMIGCARAGAEDSSTRANWLLKGWELGDFTPQEESQIIALYRGKFSVASTRKRINRLLYEGKTSAAKRLLTFFGRDEQKLYEARMALRNMAGAVNSRIRAVPKTYKNDAGLIFDRMRWRHKKGLESGVYEMLAAAPNTPPHADSWWPIRNLYARKALRKGHVTKALSILQKHGEMNRVNMAEARWLIGWIYHSFKHDYRKAYKTFYALHENVSTPVSRARAAYWAASSARKNNNADIAKQWMERAAQYTTVFYGQLAHAELYPNERLPLPKKPEASSREKRRFDNQDLTKLVVTLARYKQKDAIDTFLVHMAKQAQTPQQFVLLANLARAIGSDFDAVRVAKRALRENIILPHQGWPVVTLPQKLAVPTEFALSITRQESEFDTTAKSHAGARGLMQLMPATARSTARKNGMPYKLSMLWQPVYNMVLGSTYLHERVNAYNGSYILAIASYNAGPGNVSKWLKEFGQPRNSVAGKLHWIESIPFTETRNYVQRVLENLQVYRARLGKRNSNQIKQDLLR